MGPEGLWREQVFIVNTPQAVAVGKSNEANYNDSEEAANKPG